MTISWDPISKPTAASQAHRDPYLEFAERTGKVDLRPGVPRQRIPIIVQLEEGNDEHGKPMTAASFAERWAGSRLRVPPAYRNPAASLGGTRYLTSTVVDPGFFHELGDTASTLGNWVRRIEPTLPVDEDAGSYNVAYVPDDPGAGTQQGKVVIGVIDDGLNFACDRYCRSQNGTLRTRFAAVWDQNALPQSAPPPPGFSYGAELTRIEIDQMLDKFKTHCGVDEEGLYRAHRTLFKEKFSHYPLRRRASHGAAVLDLAAQLPANTAPGDVPIIGVQLPYSTTADTSGATLNRYVLDGLRFIILRADKLAAGHGALPIVVNISYGLIAGPHDGTSILEEAMDELIRQRRSKAPFQIVLPAGNNNLSRCHASFDLTPGATKKLQWRIQPGDRTPSFLEIWLPELGGGRATIEVSVTTPCGQTSPFVPSGQVCALMRNNQVLAEIIHLGSTGTPGLRNRDPVLIAIAPTATLERDREVAPGGLWEVSVRNVGADAIGINAWIQRDDAAPGYPIRGRQSYFDDPDYLRLDPQGRTIEVDPVPSASYVRRAGTLNAIATGDETAVVGGCIRISGSPAWTSAAGPALPRQMGPLQRHGPDCMAPSEDSCRRGNVLTAGTRSGSRAAMGGTSVAAPLVASAVARGMLDGQVTDRAWVRTQAQLHEPGTWPKPKPPEERGGAGRMQFPPRGKPRP